MGGARKRNYGLALKPLQKKNGEQMLFRVSLQYQLVLHAHGLSKKLSSRVCLPQCSKEAVKLQSQCN